MIIIIFIFIDYYYWFIDLSISLLPLLLQFIILYCRIFQRKGIICRHFDNLNRVSLYAKCHRNQPKFKEKRTKSVEIVASDSLSPSWWCFKRFSTTNAGLKSRLRHRICQKHSRKCANFLQFDILNKILHANYGYKFTKKIEKNRKSETVFFSVILTTCRWNFPPPSSHLIYKRHRLRVASKSAEFQEASRITIICTRLWPVGRLITEFSPE